MASIAEWIEKIKTAIYGEEVRGAIWQSLEAMNTEVEAINVDEDQIEQNKQDIAGLKGNFLYFTDTNSTQDGSTASERFKVSMQRALTSFSSTAPTVNKTYPIMCVFSGASNGTFNGTLSVTSTAIRFFISNVADSYAGTFVRNNSSITWFMYPSRSEVDANTAAIADLNSRYIVRSTQSESLSINGGSRGTITIPMGQEGYTLIGVLSVYPVDTEVFAIARFGVASDTSAVVTLINTYTESRSSRINVAGLYRKS